MALAFAVAGCQFDAGALEEATCTQGACPSGSVCVDGLCIVAAEDTRADAPLVDTAEVQGDALLDGDDAFVDNDPCAGTCTARQLCCEEPTGPRCVEFLSDVGNCGGCGIPCVASACVQGVCTCQGGTADCDANPANGCEADILTRADHCGACTETCDAPFACHDGVCLCGTTNCSATQRCCDSAQSVTCVNVASSPAHCGACGDACGAGEDCVAGACACGTGPACGGTDVCCAGTCVAQGDSQCDCGSVGVTCLAQERCCDNVCIDVLSADTACGACGVACGAPQHCAQGACTCNDGALQTCGSECIDTDTDVNHCGDCATTCAARELCCGGVCGGVGAASRCPGTSCAELLSKGLTADGVYWIAPAGTPFEAYCDMTTDGGGWTLLMKGTGDGTFDFDANSWTTANTLNPSDLTTAAGNAKYPAFNSLPLAEVRAVFPAIAHTMREPVLNAMTALQNFDDEDNLGDVWAQWYDGWPKQGGFHRYGFANDPWGCSSRVRWGWVWNNEGCCCVSSDAVSGIGTNRGPDVGAYAECCTSPGGQEGSYPERVLLWGR